MCFISVVSLFPLMAAPTSSSPPANQHSGLEGTILVSPARGGPTRQGVSDSAPLANTAFLVKKENEVVAYFSTDESGHFHVALEPGHYLVDRKEQHRLMDRCGPFEIDVPTGQVTQVQWSCDMGIR